MPQPTDYKKILPIWLYYCNTMQKAFTRYIVCRWSPQIRSLKGHTVHTNIVAAAQPNVAPDYVSAVRPELCSCMEIQAKCL